MKIAIDVDEVLCETVRLFLVKLEEEKGIKGNYEDLLDYSLEKVFGLDFEEVHEIFNKIISEDLVDELSLVDGARENVLKLNEHNQIFFITARHIDFKDFTFKFIEENFFENPEIYYSGDIHDNWKKNKDEICFDLGVDLIIEDNGRTSLGYAKNGLKVILLDKPWNQGVEHENIFRCFNWDEAVRKIDELSLGVRG